jgi:hypothetical protein
MKSNYKIDPVKATQLKMESDASGTSLQELSDTCYGIVAAFEGSNSSQIIDRTLAQQCDNYIEQNKLLMLNVGSCDHQAPYRPVVWNQVPPFVPMLMNKGATPERALAEAEALCQQNPLIAEECMEKNRLYYNAIVDVGEIPLKSTKMILPNLPNGSREGYDCGCDKGGNMLLWGVIIFAIIIAIIIQNKNSNK